MISMKRKTETEEPDSKEACIYTRLWTSKDLKSMADDLQNPMRTKY